MHKLMLACLLGCLAFSAPAQEVPAKFRGTNPNPNAPVNVPDAAQRPANPEVKQATPVKGGQVFRVKDNKPDTRRRQRPAFPADMLPKKDQPAVQPE